MDNLREKFLDLQDGVNNAAEDAMDFLTDNWKAVAATAITVYVAGSWVNNKVKVGPTNFNR